MRAVRPRIARLAWMLALLAAGRAGADDFLTVCTEGGLCGEVRAIDDEQMAAVAGKFTIAGEVVGMNLLLHSAWQAADGQRLEASATLAVRLPASGQSGVWTDARASGSAATPAPPQPAGGFVDGGAGLRGMNGVAQLIQVAGNGNGAANRGTLEIGTRALANPAGNGQVSAAYQAANGAQARVDVNNSGAALRLTMPTGMAMQNVSTSGIIGQHIAIAGDRQQVLNQLQLQVQILPMSSALYGASGFTQALNMLRGR
ncbi:hypothetical protein [Janthinobacterium sp.]|uniref:hypothetical protein n=1 Tax=Janthinobacterium sp. TaxID=1871054 RepID=UPI00293D27AF|nr:hypothetical protein [Janthinobacterium sp.]